MSGEMTFVSVLLEYEVQGTSTKCKARQAVVTDVVTEVIRSLSQTTWMPDTMLVQQRDMNQSTRAPAQKELTPAEETIRQHYGKEK